MSKSATAKYSFLLAVNRTKWASPLQFLHPLNLERRRPTLRTAATLLLQLMILFLTGRKKLRYWLTHSNLRWNSSLRRVHPARRAFYYIGNEVSYIIKKPREFSLGTTKGDSRIWTGDKGVADPCLTTWLCRHILFYSIFLSKMTPRGFEPLLPPWKGGVLTAWPWSQIFLFSVLGPKNELPLLDSNQRHCG